LDKEGVRIIEDPVAVVILNYNGLKSLGNTLFDCIESVLRINYDTLETFLVDNGSSDGSVDTVKERFGDSITYVMLRKNYGYALGNVLGLEIAMKLTNRKYKYVVFMNNDFIVTNADVIKELKYFMELRPSVAIASGIMLTRNARRVDNAGVFEDFTLWEYLRCVGLRPEECISLGFSYVSAVQGAFMMVNLNVLGHLRRWIFNPRFFLQYEETELCLNSWTYGYRVAVVPTICGIHIGSATIGRKSPLTRYLYHRNKFYVARNLKNLRNLYLTSLLANEFLGSPYQLMFRGYEGRLRVRALIDGIRKKISTQDPGPYFPLILIDKSIWKLFNNMFIKPINYASIQRVRSGEGLKHSLLTLRDDDIKKTSNPFLINI
jgi:GT2 family glycosyltransferase